MSWDDKLLLAVWNNRIEDVRICINNGADVNYNKNKSLNLDFPLTYAIIKNSKKVVKYLLENGADPDKYVIDSLLTYSILNEQWQIAKLLVNAVTNLNKGNPPPLFTAVQKNCLDMVQCIVSRGADIDIVYKQKTPLIKALQRRNEIISKFLIDSGADINKKYKNQTPLDIAVKHNLNDIAYLLVEKNSNAGIDTLMFLIDEKNLEMIKYLVENGANVNKLGKKGETPLSYAVRTQQVEIIKWLLENGAQFSVHSALDCAIDTENIEIVKLLIQKGSKVNLQRKKINTPLVKAIQLKNFEIVKELVVNGADVNLISIGTLPLIEATELNQVEIVKYLVEQGADPNLRDDKGNLPLIKAIEMRQLETVQELIENGVDVNSSDKNGKTPLIRALEIGDEQITKILLEQETNLVSNSSLLMKYVENKNLKAVELLLKCKEDLIDAVSDCGYTPLTKSAQIDNYKMLDFLVKKGANVNVEDQNQNTALSLAVSNRNFQMIEYLLNNGADVNVGKEKWEAIANTDDDVAFYFECVLEKKQEERKREGVPAEETKKSTEEKIGVLESFSSSANEEAS